MSSNPPSATTSPGIDTLSSSSLLLAPSDVSDAASGQSSQQETNSSSSASPGIIAGCIAAAIALFILLFWFQRRRAAQKKKSASFRRSFGGTEASFWNSDDAASHKSKTSSHSYLPTHTSVSGSHSSMDSKTFYTIPHTRYSVAASDVASDTQEIMSEAGARTSFFGHEQPMTIVPTLPHHRPASEMSMSPTFRPPTAFSIASNNLTSISRNKKLIKSLSTHEMQERSSAPSLTNRSPSQASLGYGGLSTAGSRPGQLVTSTFIARPMGPASGV